MQLSSIETWVGIAQIITAVVAFAGLFVVIHLSGKGLESAERLTRESRVKDLRSDLFDRSVETSRLLAQVSSILGSTQTSMFAARKGFCLWQSTVPLPEEYSAIDRTVRAVSWVEENLEQTGDLCQLMRGLVRGMNRDLTGQLINEDFLSRLERESKEMRAIFTELLAAGMTEPYYHPYFDDQPNEDARYRHPSRATEKRVFSMPVAVPLATISHIATLEGSTNLKDQLPALEEFAGPWTYRSDRFPEGKPEDYTETMESELQAAHTEAIEVLRKRTEQLRSQLATWTSETPTH